MAEVFEIVDYTDSTPLERLISDIEMALINVADSQLEYNNLSFQLGFSPTPLQSSNVLKWTGIQKFFVIQSKSRIDISTCKLLLSCCIISLRNVQSDLGVVIQLGNSDANTFLGYMNKRILKKEDDLGPNSSNSLEYRYRSIVLPKASADKTSVDNLLQFFVERSHIYLLLKQPDIHIHIRKTFCLDLVDEVNANSKPTKPRIDYLTLHIDYGRCTVNSVNISRVSDFIADPAVDNCKLQLKANFFEKREMFSSALLNELMLALQESDPDFSNELDVSIKKPAFSYKASLKSMNITESVKQGKIIAEIVDNVFSESSSCTFKSPCAGIDSSFQFPPDSFCHIFVMSIMPYTSLIKRLRSVWVQCIKRLNLNWENGLYIPNTQMDVNLKTPIINQKLAMLNDCIRRKIKAGGYRKPETDSPGRKTPSTEKSLVHQDSVSALSKKFMMSLSKFANITADAVVEALTPDLKAAPVVDASPQNSSLKSEASWKMIKTPSNIESEGDELESTKSGPLKSTPYKFDSGSDLEESFLNHLDDEPEITEPEGRKKATGLKLLQTGEDAWVPETQEPELMTEDTMRQREVEIERSPRKKPDLADDKAMLYLRSGI